MHHTSPDVFFTQLHWFIIWLRRANSWCVQVPQSVMGKMTGSIHTLWTLKCQDVWCRNRRENGTPRVHHGEGDTTYMLPCGNEGGGLPWEPFSGGAGDEDLLCQDFPVLSPIMWLTLLRPLSLLPMSISSFFFSSLLFSKQQKTDAHQGQRKRNQKVGRQSLY